MDIKRITSAAILIPTIILFIYFAQPLLWLFLILIIGTLALNEFNNMSLFDVKSSDKRFTFFINAITIASVYFTESTAFAALFAFIAVAFYHLIKPDTHKDILKYILKDMLGIFYCGVLPSYIMLIRILDGKIYICLLLLTIWTVDTAAYYVGCSIGRRKLIPNISPNKTWEGSIGGVIGAVALLIAAKIMYFTNFSFLEATIFGIILSVTAQIGDLFESLLKRAKGIKDSGDLIPGHGGMLDRIDSLLFTAPVFFYFTLFFSL